MPLLDLFIQFRFRYIKNLGNSIIDFFSQIKGLFRTFGIIDVVDIIFVAALIYLVVRVMRETRAMQLIKGFLLLFLVYLVVTFLGMGASSYIMRMIFNNILIILVILFGPEIRKILEQIGKGKAQNLLKGLFNSGVAIDVAEMKKTIDATCKACAEMSDAKIGALIVFENDTLLGDIIKMTMPDLATLPVENHQTAVISWLYRVLGNALRRQLIVEVRRGQVRPDR